MKFIVACMLLLVLVFMLGLGRVGRGSKMNPLTRDFRVNCYLLAQKTRIGKADRAVLKDLIYPE